MNSSLFDTPTLPIEGNFPGVTLIGVEPNGITVDVREINGFVWIARNAYFDQGLLQWTQANPALSSSAEVLGPGGVKQIYTVAAGASAPLNWGSPIFQST